MIELETDEGLMQPSIEHRPAEARSYSLARRIGQFSLGVGLVLTPVAAGVDMMLAAPPAVVHDVGLDGVDVSVQPHIGGSTNIDASVLGGLRRANDIRMPGLSVGFTIQSSAANVQPLSQDGKFNTATTTAVGHILSDPAARTSEFNRVKSEVIKYYGTIGFGSAYLVAMAEIAAYAYLKRRHQDYNEDSLGNNTKLADTLERDIRFAKVVSSVLAACIVAPALSAVAVPNRDSKVIPNPLLQGTSFQGWQITGPFSDTIEHGIGLIDGYSKEENSYYDTVIKNVNDALQAHYGTSKLAADKDETRIIIAGDEQGTDGMSRVVGTVAQAFSANAILNLGDITATGTSQEAYLNYLKSYSLTTLKASAGKIPLYTTLGRHDTPAVATQAKKAGFTVIDGKIVNIGGVPTLGFDSPYIVNFGQASKLRDPKVTLADAQQQLHDRAVSAEGSALLIAGHDTEDTALLDDVTEPLQITNHDFITQPPVTKTVDGEKVTKLVLGSTGGHGQDDGFGGLGDLRNPASIMLLTVEHTTGNVYDTIVTVNPDTTVNLRVNYLPSLTPDQLKLLKPAA